MKSSKAKRAPRGGRSTAAAAAIPQPVRRSYLWPAVIGAAATFLAVFILYSPAMSGPFLLDDDYLPYRTPFFFSRPWSVWMPCNRPLLSLSFWLTLSRDGQCNS